MQSILVLLLSCLLASTSATWGSCGGSVGPLNFQHAQDEPQLSFFDPEAYGSYIAHGHHRTINTVPKGTPSDPVPSLLVWDKENKRIFFNHTNNVHIITETGGWFIIPPFGLCFQTPEYNYSHWVANWGELNEFDVGADIKLLPPPPSADIEKIHSGWVHDQHACPGLRIQFTAIQNSLGAVSKLHWTAPFRVRQDAPIPPLRGLEFIVTQTSWFNRIEKKCPPTSYWQLPAICTNALSFEQFFNCTGSI